SRYIPKVPETFVRRTRANDGACRRDRGERKRGAWSVDDDRNGKDIEVGGRGSRQVRVGLPVLRRKCRTVFSRRGCRDACKEELHPLSTARSRARGHALEFSVLASLPVRRSGIDGGKHRVAETRVECAAMRT